MAVLTSIAPATESFLDRQQGRTLPIFIRIVPVADILAQRLGLSGSEGGMLAAVDLISAVVELDDLVESVDLLVALGGGQSGGNSSFSRFSLSQLLIFSQGFHFIWIWMGSFDAGSSCGSNTGRLSRNGWLVVDRDYLYYHK
eukprot:scaffold59225_cov26-Attheya_sp.AAC.1